MRLISERDLGQTFVYFFTLGDFKTVQRLWEEIVKGGHYPDHMSDILALAALVSGNNERALELFSLCVKKAPNSALAYSNRGAIYKKLKMK